MPEAIYKQEVVQGRTMDYAERTMKIAWQPNKEEERTPKLQIELGFRTESPENVQAH